jgi:hypothetical protein
MRPPKPSPSPAAGSSISAVVLFGMDEHGKPKAAKFSDKHADVATKAAGALQLRVLAVTDPKVADLAAKLPAGRIHANGRGFVPFVRRDLYAKLLEAAGPGADQSASQSPGGAGSSGAGGPGNPNAPGREPISILPQNWDEIGQGHLVISQDDPEDGWYEAIVLARRGDMLTLKSRDYPGRSWTEHVFAVGLMCPLALPGTDHPTASPPDPKAAKPKGSDAKSPATEVGAFPKTWADIAVNSLVLAKQDGPWPGWWEAIPTDQAGDSFTVRWRDYPRVPNVTRHRHALALLYPNSPK